MKDIKIEKLGRQEKQMLPWKHIINKGGSDHKKYTGVNLTVAEVKLLPGPPSRS